MLLLGQACNQVGIKLASQRDDTNPLRRLCDAALAQEVEVFADLLVGLDLGCDAWGQWVVADGEVGGEGDFNGAI